MQERVPRAKFARLEPEKQFNGLDQKLYEDDRVHQEREDKLCDREDCRTKKLSQKTREQLNQQGNTGSEGTKSRPRKTG